MKLKFRWVIYASAFFAIVYLVLKNPAPYTLATNRLSSWFARSFGAFGRVSK